MSSKLTPRDHSRTATLVDRSPRVRVNGHVIPQGWRHAIPHGVRCCRLVSGDLLGIG
jgi:hypothetical protein